MRGDTRHRLHMPLRIGAVLLGYGVYRVVEPERFGAAVFLGLGTLLLGFVVVDRLTLRRRERLELLQMGTGLLAAGLLACGLYLLLR